MSAMGNETSSGKPQARHERFAGWRLHNSHQDQDDRDERGRVVNDDGVSGEDTELSMLFPVV